MQFDHQFTSEHLIDYLEYILTWYNKYNCKNIFVCLGDEYGRNKSFNYRC